jgi:xylulose-5-phosphate/fructose-6-phosphate phosphoketolase
VGDGEAETGPLATSWHSNKFLNPVTDGAVLPILHLNGYKISNPTVLARISREELEQFLRGCGWTPFFVEGHEPNFMHEAMAATLDKAVEQLRQIQQEARLRGKTARVPWPMIVLNSPKGAGPDPRSSTACRSRGLFAPIRSRCPSQRKVPNICRCWKAG